MSDLFLYQCKKCHIVTSYPDIMPGADYCLGSDIIEAWCPVCKGFYEMILILQSEDRKRNNI